MVETSYDPWYFRYINLLVEGMMLMFLFELNRELNINRSWFLLTLLEVFYHRNT